MVFVPRCAHMSATCVGPQKTRERKETVPINIAELVLSTTALGRDGDVESATSGHSASNAGHDDDGYVFEWNVG